MSQVPKRLVKQLIERDGLVCQWCGIEYPSMDGYPIVPHHRRNRGMGSSEHKLSEIALVCAHHNQEFEDGLRGEPLDRGFRIPRNHVIAAADVPLTDHEGNVWFLTDRGTKIQAFDVSEVPC